MVLKGIFYKEGDYSYFKDNHLTICTDADLNSRKEVEDVLAKNFSKDEGIEIKENKDFFEVYGNEEVSDQQNIETLFFWENV